MGHLTTMQLLPTIIILALLAFFVVLTSILLVLYWQRTKIVKHKRLSKDSRFFTPRRLTLRDGKAIPHDLAAETVSDRDRYSLDLQSPGIEKEFEYDVEKGFTKPTPSKSSKRVSRTSLRSLLAERGQTWSPGKPPWLQKPGEQRASHAGPETKAKRVARSKNRARSRSIPRPSLINIERRGSGQTQRSSDPPPRRPPRQSVGRRTSSQVQMTPAMQQKRRGMDITESLFNAYKGTTPWAGEIHELPPTSVVMPGPARTIASSTRSSGNRWSVPATASIHSSSMTAPSLIGSSRVVSDPESIKAPAPLFSNVAPRGPHTSFTPTKEANRKSYLTITDSPTSSTSSEHAVLGHSVPAPVIAEAPSTAPIIPSVPAINPTYLEQSRPVKALSAPAPNPPEVLERVRAFGRKHHERPTSTGLRPKVTAEIQRSQDGPVSLSQRRQVSSELLRHIDRPRSSMRRDDGTSDLVQQLEETATLVQRQSIAANFLLQQHENPSTGPRRTSQGPWSLAADSRRPRSSLIQRRIPRSVSQRPPSIEIDIPHVERGSMSFIEGTPTPTPPRSGADLGRGPSVMSNRSGFTIASSEISSNWTIGKAELVNIYPSVADDEDEGGSLQEGKGDGARLSPNARRTPPYAKVLRSKYGQYPRGMRDKALPRLPMSPLRQSTSGI